jgi:hypothetical protein
MLPVIHDGIRGHTCMEGPGSLLLTVSMPLSYPSAVTHWGLKHAVLFSGHASHALEEQHSLSKVSIQLERPFFKVTYGIPRTLNDGIEMKLAKWARGNAISFVGFLLK